MRASYYNSSVVQISKMLKMSLQLGYLLLCTYFLVSMGQTPTTTTTDSIISLITKAGKGHSAREEVAIPEHYATWPPSADPDILLLFGIDDLKLNHNELTCNISTWFDVSWKDHRLLELYHTNNTSPHQGSKLINSSLIWKPGVLLRYVHNLAFQTHSGKATNLHDKVRVILPPDKNPGRLHTWTNGSQWMTVQSKDTTFQYFPGDAHTCELNVSLGTLRHTVGNFTLLLTNPVGLTDPLFTITVQEQVALSYPGLRGIPGSYYESSNTLMIRIVFERKLGYSLIQTYLPSVLFVLVALLSLLLPVDIAAERVSICTGILLTLTIFLNSARQEGPSVHYLRAQDVWLMGCIGFVFMTILQNIIILRMTAKETTKGKSAIGNLINANATLLLQMGGCGGRDGAENENGVVEGEESENRDEKNPIHSAKLLNKISLIIFPTVFVLCNVAYWVTLYAHSASKYF